MKTFLLASGNKHKAEEFKELFEGKMGVYASPGTLEVDETGKTFTENALIKAKAYFDVYKVPTLADDSGLVLEAFPDLLSVQSARFAPDLKEYSDKCNRILELYREKNPTTRNAYFVCVLCFYYSDDEYYFFEGRVHGVIGERLQGSKGFGYDPIFIPERKENDGATLAELPEWKNEFSHRAKASRAALGFFQQPADRTV
ncbi:MAG: non-canonical purine NTP pyrophosphatase [Bdellovibrionota bacterium]